jgi:hypothetical protein
VVLTHFLVIAWVASICLRKANFCIVKLLSAHQVMANAWSLFLLSMFLFLCWVEEGTQFAMLLVVGLMKRHSFWMQSCQKVISSEVAIDVSELPYNDYIEYYGPDFRLHIPQTNMENLNSKDYLERYK